MTLHEAAVYLHHDWTVTRLAWNRPEWTLRKVHDAGRWVFKASAPEMSLTHADFEADDWVKVAQHQ